MLSLQWKRGILTETNNLIKRTELLTTNNDDAYNLNSTKTSRFRKIVEQNKHLVAVEAEEPIISRALKPAKKIVSYTAVRDTLFIPNPEKPKRPIDIRHNLIEEKPILSNADIGMQSDQINYVDQTKPFFPQKIGKDVSVQIEDGDLFNFDRDVESILQVLCGKILEQTELELMQEAEIKNLRETKETYFKKFRAKKEEIKALEEQELEKKKENDNLLKLKRLQKMAKIDIQQKLISRVFTKNFLQNFLNNTMTDLIQRGSFEDYASVNIWDNLHNFVLTNSEQQYLHNVKFEASIREFHILYKERKKAEHNQKVLSHKNYIIEMKIQAQRIREEEAKKKRVEEEEKKERKRLRAIARLRETIKKNIFTNYEVRKEYHLEEVNEIDNHGTEGAFVGVYGGLIGLIMTSLTVIRKFLFKGDHYFTQDNVNIILIQIYELLMSYFSEGTPFNLVIDSPTEEKILLALNKENFDVKEVKTSQEMTNSDWQIIYNILSDVETNCDHIFKHFYYTKLADAAGITFYPMIIKALISMLEKSLNLERINLIFKQSEAVQDWSQFKALCRYDLPETPSEIIEATEIIKDFKKKRPISILDFSKEIKISKLFTKQAELNVLIYDKNAEFIVRNKIFECFLKVINVEADVKPLYKVFNESYDSFLPEMILPTKIQEFKFTPDEFERKMN